MGESILTAQNLSKVVPSAEGELTILHSLSLELSKGDSLAIVGASGSGKSTLLGLLAGLDLPSQGEVILAGLALSTLDWCKYSVEIEHARDGYGHVAANLWSPEGELIAISRQTVTVFG